MLPILGLAAAAVSALTAGQAAVIGASVGAATAIGANAFGKKKETGESWRYAEADVLPDDVDEETLEAVKLAMRLLDDSARRSGRVNHSYMSKDEVLDKKRGRNRRAG